MLRSETFEHYFERRGYYLQRIATVAEKRLRRRTGPALYCSGATDLNAYKQIVFFFDDPSMHIGDQLFFKPLANKLCDEGRRVAVIPTRPMRPVFAGYATDIAESGNSLFVSRFECLPALRRQHAPARTYCLFDIGSLRIDRPISNFLVDSFADTYGLSEIDRAITANDYLAGIETRTLNWEFSQHKNLIFLSNAIDSGRHRLTHVVRTALIDALRERKEPGDYVVQLGTKSDKHNDPNTLSDIVDLDLRGETQVPDLFKLLALPNIKRVYCHDTAILHIANLFELPVTVAFRRFFSHGARRQKVEAFACLFENKDSNVEILRH